MQVAYCDVSRDDQVFAASALFGSLTECLELERKWKAALARHNLVQFDAGACDNGLPPFDGFDRNQRDAIQRCFYGLITERQLWGFSDTVSVNPGDNLPFVIKKRWRRRGLRAEALALEATLERMSNALDGGGWPLKEQVASVFDRGQEGEAVYDLWVGPRLTHRAGSISFETSATFPCLEAAAAWGYECRKYAVDALAGNPNARWQFDLFRNTSRVDVGTWTLDTLDELVKLIGQNHDRALRKGVWSGPSIELRQSPDETWTIELLSFKQLDQAFGREVVANFCRCFVHIDRLTSMTSFAYTSEQHFGRDSIAFSRDLNTMVWFTIGTLRELAKAIADLHASLARRGILDKESSAWKSLGHLEKRWNQDPNYMNMRNRAAFHLDADVVSVGLDELETESEDLQLSKGKGPKQVNTLLSLGFLALHNGLGMKLEDFSAFLQAVAEDHGVASSAVQEAFIGAARIIGIPDRKIEWP